MAAIAGTAFVKADDQQFPLKGSLTVSPSMVEREMISGQDRVHGYKEMPRVPFVEMTVSTLGELSLERIEAMTGVTVTAELKNGRVYVFRNATCTAAFEIDTEEGQFTVKFEGESCDELS